MSKRNIIIIGIAVITIFNLAALSTLVYYHFLKAEPTTNTEFKLPDRQYARWFQQELDLDQDQFLVFREANRAYHFRGREILYELEALRELMFEELNNEQSDTIALQNYAYQIGELHRELKELTIEYYMKMKGVCNPDQKEKLYKIFNTLLNQNEEIPIPE